MATITTRAGNLVQIDSTAKTWTTYGPAADAVSGTYNLDGKIWGARATSIGDQRLDGTGCFDYDHTRSEAIDAAIDQARRWLRSHLARVGA